MEDASTDPPIQTPKHHAEILKEIAEDKKKFIEKRKMEKEAQEKKLKDDLLKGNPHKDSVPLKPGGGDPSDLETIKRRNFIKNVSIYKSIYLFMEWSVSYILWKDFYSEAVKLLVAVT